MSKSSLIRQFGFGVLITAIVVVIAFYGRGDYGHYLVHTLSNLHPHAPDLALIGKQPLEIKIHMFGALLAFGVGIIQFVGPKGTGLHRFLGWSWVIFMAAVAISSVFIRQLNNGQFSLIHIFTIITVINLPLLVYYARKKNIIGHKSAATGLFMGALIIAGIFAFMPGRLMWQIFFG